MSLSSCHHGPKSEVNKPFVSETKESACVCVRIVLLLWLILLCLYNNLISARRPDLIIINKKKITSKIVNFASMAGDRINWRDVKRRINTWTLLGNWKPMEHKGDNYTNRDWCFWFSHQRIIKGLVDEWRSSKLQHYWDRPEYWEESWRLEKTCCYSNSSERQSAKTNVKISQGIIIIWPSTMHYITVMTLNDYMYQEKRDKGDLPASKTALTHRYDDSKTT